jgi:hypothetical protein
MVMEKFGERERYHENIIGIYFDWTTTSDFLTSDLTIKKGKFQWKIYCQIIWGNRIPLSNLNPIRGVFEYGGFSPIFWQAIFLGKRWISGFRGCHPRTWDKRRRGHLRFHMRWPFGLSNRTWFYCFAKSAKCFTRCQWIGCREHLQETMVFTIQI